MVLRIRALELDNQRLTNLLNITPQKPYTGPGVKEAIKGAGLEALEIDDLGEQTFQNAQEWARRGRAAQKAVDEIIQSIQKK